MGRFGVLFWGSILYLWTSLTRGLDYRVLLVETDEKFRR